MDIIMHEVKFEGNCQKCVYWELDGGEEPCNECLGTPMNEHSRKPVKFKDKEESK